VYTGLLCSALLTHKTQSKAARRTQTENREEEEEEERISRIMYIKR